MKRQIIRRFKIFTTNKCPLCRFLLIAGVLPVLNSMTPSLPLTSLCDTLEHNIQHYWNI